MRSVVSIHQPSYFTWFGLLDKIVKSDTFVILDDVQFNRRAFQHRTLYSNPSGKPAFLTLTVDARGSRTRTLPLNQVPLKPLNHETLQEHHRLLLQRYGKLTPFRKYRDELADLFSSEYDGLIEVVMRTFRLMLKVFRVTTAILRSSDLRKGADSRKAELMLDLTEAAGGETYLSGRGARAYMNDELFLDRGVKVTYQDFTHIEYDQALGRDFQAGCLALELPFMHENFMELLHQHYARIGQLPLVRGVAWES